MKRRWIFVFCSVLFLAGSFGISAQAQPAEAQKHVAAARALAYEPGFDYTFSFETICAEPRPAGARGGRGAGAVGGGGGRGQRGDDGQRDGGGQRHTAALLGGRDPLVNGEGVQYFPTEFDATKAWKASVVRFQDIAAKAGADVFLITRGQNDHLPDRIRGLNYRRPGAPHPFVSKDSVKRYMAMTVECMDAQLAWQAGK